MVRENSKCYREYHMRVFLPLGLMQDSSSESLAEPLLVERLNVSRPTAK